MTPILRHEQMRPGFDKIHLEQGPFAPFALHWITEPEILAHDHPWNFRTHILQGWYVERVWSQHDGQWLSHERLLEPGMHEIAATHIHEIVQVAPGGCLTAVVAGPTVRKSRFWRFEHGRGVSWGWDEYG